MRRFFQGLISCVVTLSSLSACSDIYVEENNPTGNDSDYGVMNVLFEESESRTYIDENASIYWHNGDRVAVFYGDDVNVESAFEGSTGDKSGKIRPVESIDEIEATLFDAIYALYPYESGVAISNEGVISFELPAEQSYTESTFARGANAMAAVTESINDRTLSFRNLGSSLVLSLWGDATIRSVRLTGNHGELLAGEATAVVSYAAAPELSIVGGGSTSVTLNCSEGVVLGNSQTTPTEFWIVLPPVEFAEGFTIEVEDSDGRIFRKSTTKRINIDRNVVQPMAALEVVFPDLPASNQLWYTTSSGSQLSFSSGAFNHAIKSQTKVDGKWVVTFDGTLTEVCTEAFDSMSSLVSVTLPDSVERIGDYAFYNCTSLQTVRLSQSLSHIGMKAFRYCDAITDLTIPQSLESFGSLPFDYSTIRNLTICCNLEGTTLESGALASDPLFYGAAIENLIITSDVDYVGGYSFVFNSSLESVEIAYGVTSIGDGAFMECDNLTSVTFPASITSIGERVLSGCGSLVSVTSLAELPPTLGSNAFPQGTQVRVYDYAVTAYQEDEEWGKYILSNLAGERYTSTDYSEHGKVTTLQSASEGNGIDIVFMGDGYSDRQIAAGIYDEHIGRAVEHFFSEEPYTTFRELFNIYKVNVVSREEGYSVQGAASNTALQCYIDDTGLVCGENYSAYWFAQEAIGDDEQRNDEVLVVVIMNSNEYGGTCYMSSPLMMPDDKFANGKAVAYFPLCGDDTYFRRLILHEAAGHGFAKLGDEYFYSGNGHISSYDYYLSQDLVEKFGWYRNVDFALEGELTAETVKWRHFLADERYAYDGLGVFEGALTYKSGAYRPTDYSIMRSNEGGFNAPSREAIYQRIHALAYGSSWSYDYETFVAYDAKNRKEATNWAMSQSLVYSDALPHHAPVVE